MVDGEFDNGGITYRISSGISVVLALELLTGAVLWVSLSFIIKEVRGQIGREIGGSGKRWNDQGVFLISHNIMHSCFGRLVGDGRTGFLNIPPL